jgi:hypothetical protein
MRCAAYGGLAYEKPQSALRPFVRFFSGTFGAGVNATHCPITRPKRRIQPGRYMQFCLKFSVNVMEKIIE